jgi:hypothetical protein
MQLKKIIKILSPEIIGVVILILAILWVITQNSKYESYIVLFTAILAVITSVFSIINLIKMKYCTGEHNLHQEWRKKIQDSSTIKLFLLRGARLFDEVNGVFYLENISDIPNLQNKCFQIILLDFQTITEDEYNQIQKIYSIDFRNFKHDQELNQITIDNLKKLKTKGYNIEFKLMKIQHISDRKMIIYDDIIYYTEYKSKSLLHQKGEYHKINSTDKDFDTIKNIFNSAWNML